MSGRRDSIPWVMIRKNRVCVIRYLYMYSIVCNVVFSWAIGENKNSRLTLSYSELPCSSGRQRDNGNKAAATQQVGSAVAVMSSTARRQHSPESPHFRHVRPRPNRVCAIRRLRKKKDLSGVPLLKGISFSHPPTRKREKWTHLLFLPSPNITKTRSKELHPLRIAYTVQWILSYVTTRFCLRE